MAKKALLVGINDYESPGGPDLHGCVNDVRDMAHTLNVVQSIRPGPGSLRILTDGRATRANIVAGLQWLVKGPKKGDLLIFYYSGHGSQLPDLDGDNPDEPDKKDETICPHDYVQAGMIRDDDIRQALAGIPPGVNMEVVFDSCHAGTATKDTLISGAPPAVQEVAYRYVEPPVDYAYFLDANPRLKVQTLMGKTITERKARDKDTVVVPDLNHVLWAACRDYQTSAEAPMRGVWRGIFTYCFCRVLRRTSGQVTRARLDSLVSADMQALPYSQVPQLEGSAQSIGERVFT